MRAFTMHLHLVSLIVLSLYDYDNLEFSRLPFVLPHPYTRW